MVRVLDMKACDTGIFMCPTTGRLPLGVLISAYSTNDGIFGRLLSEANAAGASVKRWNPDVPTALITHRPELTSNESFDLAVPVRDDLLMKGAPRGNDGYTPQWFTRLYYYASSPFDITIALDSNAGVCGSVMPLFEATRAVDFAVPTQLRDWSTTCGLSAKRSFYPHNFMMTYVITSKATQALFQNWVMQQLQKGVPVDDQQTLYAAIHHTIKTAGLRPGLISSAGGVSLLTLDTVYFKAWLPAVTPIISGNVTIVHPAPMFACAAWSGASHQSSAHKHSGARSRPHSAARVMVARMAPGGPRMLPTFNANQCAKVAHQSCAPACGVNGSWGARTRFERVAPQHLILPLTGGGEGEPSNRPRRAPQSPGAKEQQACRHLAERKGSGAGLARMVIWIISTAASAAPAAQEAPVAPAPAGRTGLGWCPGSEAGGELTKLTNATTTNGMLPKWFSGCILGTESEIRA